MVFTVSDSKYADELIKLCFPKNLITNAEKCELLFKYCKENNMKYLEGSYGSLVHQDFDKYFELCPYKDDMLEIEREIAGMDELSAHSKYKLPLDHTNLFRSRKHNGLYILTSSPYGNLSFNTFNILEKYPYDTYVINPNFLNYHGFIGRFHNRLRSPLWDLNFAFTKVSREYIDDIDIDILEGSGIAFAFDSFKENMWSY